MSLRCFAVLTIVVAASLGEAADEAAAGKQALDVRVQAFDVREGEGVQMLRTPATGELAEGRYRATFRLRMQGMLLSLGTAINLDVVPEAAMRIAMSSVAATVSVSTQEEPS